MFVIKRNGTEDTFDLNRIVNAIKGANKDVSEKDRLDEETILSISKTIEEKASNSKHTLNVEEIQDMVEDHINDLKKFVLARAYSQYRFTRTLLRKENTTDESILSLIDYNNEEIKQENSNKNPQVNSVQRDYMAGEVSKDLSRRFLLNEKIIKAHDDGIIHFHDMDYFAQRMNNCGLVNLDDMLQNGTVISGTLIEKPHSFSTACNIMTQIMAQVASSQYGGQSMTLAHIAPFVDVSRKKIMNSVIRELIESGMINSKISDLDESTKKSIDKIVEIRVSDEITRGVQMIQYQAITLQTTNGQAPFITLFMYINEVEDEKTKEDLVLIIKEFLKQRYQGVKNDKGIWITPAFPKLIYVLDEDNAYEGTKYFDVTKLAAKCTSKRMVPDYISAKIMKELKGGNVFPVMGCRSALTVEDSVKNSDGSHKFYGRFNQGVVTINLPDIALSSGGDYDKFWKIYDERLELCHEALQYRHNRLKGTLSDVSPILWQYGAYARLNKGETLNKLLYGGYSTLSLGYAGLYECVKYMTGESHTTEIETNGINPKEFALSVMKKLNDKCNEWKNSENIAYSVYGSPIESTTYKFSKCLQKRFGNIEGITDHGYITNSYHVNVREKINAFDKLSFEAPFQKLSPGGAISYVEAPNIENNIEAALTVMQYIYENIMYAEINIKSDYCQVCGSTGEIKIISDEKSGKLVWECPNCGNRNQNLMNVARRTCGYIGSNFWNQGRTEEINERFVHLDNIDFEEGDISNE